MKIIKQGTLSKDRYYHGECEECGAVFTFDKKEEK